MTKRLKGKVAIVTGAGSGIGRGIALAFAGEGAKVVVNDFHSKEASAVAEEIKVKGGEALAIQADVSKNDQVEKMVKKTLQAFGRIDVLVNNAGVGVENIGPPLNEITEAEWDRNYEVNLKAHFLTCRAILPLMIQQTSGKIINMCSMMSIYGRNTVSAYAAAKGGLKLLTRNMTCEWAKYNIQINGIGPGYITTSQTAPIRENGHPFNDLVMTRTPAGRWGEPEDVANAALFLASKASDFVNGHILFVDGGILANFGYVKGENDL